MNSCTHCGGNLFLEWDIDYGFYLQCFQCGHAIQKKPLVYVNSKSTRSPICYKKDGRVSTGKRPQLSGPLRGVHIPERI